MTNKLCARITGWVFLITSLFSNWSTCIICASIFFCTSYIIDEMNKKDESKN